MLEKRFNNALSELEQLIKLGIIKVNPLTEFISISFLDEQFDLLSESRKRRQDAGSMGGKQRSSNAIAKLKQCSSYKDKDKDKDKDKEYNPPLSPLPKKRKAFIAPTIPEVRQYFLDNGYDPNFGETRWHYYDVANWFDAYGNPVLNWKQKMRQVWFKPENRIKKQEMVF
jgi:hypothetical protein